MSDIDLKIDLLGNDDEGYAIVIKKGGEDWFGSYETYPTVNEAEVQIKGLISGIVLQIIENTELKKIEYDENNCEDSCLCA